MDKLKTLLSEISWTSDGKTFLTLKTTYPENIITVIKKKDGFEGVEKNGNDYTFKFNGKEFNELDELLKDRKVKRILKKASDDINKRIEKLEKNLKYKDHGAHGQSKKEIRSLKDTQKELKKYI